jgi:hypothetical protein
LFALRVRTDYFKEPAGMSKWQSGRGLEKNC